MSREFFKRLMKEKWRPENHAQVAKVLQENPSLVDKLPRYFPGLKRKWWYHDIEVHKNGLSVTLKSIGPSRGELFPAAYGFPSSSDKDHFLLLEFPKSRHLDLFAEADVVFGGPKYAAPGSIASLGLVKTERLGIPILRAIFLQHHFRIGKTSGKVPSKIAKFYGNTRKNLLKRAIELAQQINLDLDVTKLELEKSDLNRELAAAMKVKNLTLAADRNFTVIRTSTLERKPKPLGYRVF